MKKNKLPAEYIYEKDSIWVLDLTHSLYTESENIDQKKDIPHQMIESHLENRDLFFPQNLYFYFSHSQRCGFIVKYGRVPEDRIDGYHLIIVRKLPKMEYADFPQRITSIYENSLNSHPLSLFFLEYINYLLDYYRIDLHPETHEYEFDRYELVLQYLDIYLIHGQFYHCNTEVFEID